MFKSKSLLWRHGQGGKLKPHSKLFTNNHSHHNLKHTIQKILARTNKETKPGTESWGLRCGVYVQYTIVYHIIHALSLSLHRNLLGVFLTLIKWNQLQAITIPKINNCNLLWISFLLPTFKLIFYMAPYLYFCDS